MVSILGCRSSSPAPTVSTINRNIAGYHRVVGAMETESVLELDVEAG